MAFALLWGKMRVWEIENSKEMPSDLVHEQDFILRVRRMQRGTTSYLVLNFILNAVEHLAKSLAAMEAVQHKLQEFAQASNGVYCPMSNGDTFIIWEENSQAQTIADRILTAILPEHSANRMQFLLTYHMPKDYTLLRERANHYVEIVRAAGTTGLDGVAKIDEARGVLTTKNVDQIGQLLGEIDLRPYNRTQTFYRYEKGAWKAEGQEYFISFDDLRRERFPKLEVVSSEHFFLALCSILDQRLLAMLTTNYDTIAGHRINLNVSIASIMGTVFAQFVRRIPHEHRALIGFELHRGDLFQDFALTLSAIEVLKREGFFIALDGLTPDMVPYLDLAAFAVDALKLNVSKDRAAQLTNPAIRKALERLPPEKLIFFRCDNEDALKIGRDLGVTLFQGWLIDDLAGKKS